jgi:flagellar hook-basal body complex protein FliE
MAINAVSGMLTGLSGAASGAQRPAAGAGARFTQALTRLVEDTDETSADANAKVGAMLGGTGEVHDAMIALQRADLSLQLTVQVRNKLMSAYQDIMRMPV